MTDSSQGVDIFYQWYEKCKSNLQPAEILIREDFDGKTDKWKLGYHQDYGRCLYAKEDIPEGELLFVDHPIITGPKQNCEPLCLGCYRKLPFEDQYHCSKCNWPVCSEACETSGYHPLECDTYCRAGYKFDPNHFGEENPMYESVLPLRCLVVRDMYPDRVPVLEAMEPHTEPRRGGDLWKSEQRNICDFLHEKLKLKHTDEEMHAAVGILDVNCHEVRSNIPGTKDEYRVRGLYPLTAMMSHDCSSNTHHTVMDDMTMLVVASRLIPKGEQITGTYTHLLSGTIERRKHLKYGKFFDCLCDRCKDPTELGTFFSALKCSRGSCNGFLVPAKPTLADNSSDFVCTTCMFSVKVGVVNFLTNRVYRDLKEINESDPGQLEEILAKYISMLHPNHYHIIGMKHSLSQTYGRVEGYLLKDLSPAQLQRKIDCCRQLMEVMDVIDPGISRLRGLTNYELHAPILLRANSAFQEEAITKPDFLNALTESLDLLHKTVYSLRFEPLSAFEGEICKIARKSAVELSKWLEIVKTLPNSRFLQMPKEHETIPSKLLEELSLEALLKEVKKY